MKTKRNKKMNHSNRNNIKKHVSEKSMMKIMEREIAEILRTTDFSKIDVAIYQDEKSKTLRIPKTVFALATVDANVMNWLLAETNRFPGYAQIFV